MEKRTKRLIVCSRGHKFYKSSDRPVCPSCWPGYYRKKLQNDLPPTIAAPALRALLNAKITSLASLAKHTEQEVLALHGMGPSSLPLLRKALRAKKLSFAAR
jgi:hypothetical protein